MVGIYNMGHWLRRARKCSVHVYRLMSKRRNVRATSDSPGAEAQVLSLRTSLVKSCGAPPSPSDTGFLLLTSYFLLLASYFLLLTSYFLLLTSYFLLLTSYFLLLTSYFLLLTSYFLLPTACFLLPHWETKKGRPGGAADCQPGYHTRSTLHRFFSHFG